MKIAAAAYPLDFHETWDSYEEKLARWVDGAAIQGAELLVFPEYGAMELASLAGAEAAAGLEGSLRAVAERMGRAGEVLAGLARDQGVHILGPSGPVWEGERPVNRATLYTPEGRRAHQDKQITTRFEREEWHVVPGGPLVLFETSLGRLGVLICYDCEFPLLARSLAEAGAEVLLVPSCTDTLAGYSRVRIGAMARALENQCVTVQAPTVGPAEWCPAVDPNLGAAAIYAPPDRGFPETGVLAVGAMGAPGWVVAEVSLDAIRTVRAEGGVLNFAHWPEQEPRLRHVTQACLT
ncbi:MAG: carbon-nitrogen hydrolase family protein [Paracoccaceae bacterium]|nr:carbon-nitrogen hydrolase family protein [Paracoccaceae bacterium]